MTQTDEHCTSTQHLSDAEAITILAASGAPDADYSRWYGRKMCAAPDCRGAVLRKADGTLRKHKKGSNR